MRAKVIIKYLGYVLLFNALFMYISAIISFFLKETSMVPLLYSAIVCTVIGIFPQIFIEKIKEVSFHEGMSISVFGWLLTCLAGAIPYFMWGGEFSFVNAVFESVAGFTTTGSTILNDIEALPKGLLFWRSATHFIGGMGVILFVLLILPNSQGVRSSIYRTEVSGLSMLNFHMQPRQIAKIIAFIYIGLILLETVLLWGLGMTLFDAICHSFGTLATGGFSTKNNSIAFYDNVWIELTISFFMLMGGMHFGLIFATLRREKQNIFTSKVVKTYFLVVGIGIILVAIKLTSDHVYGWWESLRYAYFQVISLVTTTGFATVDTSTWPIFTIFILIYFSIQCAMVGSTTGGIKFDRIYLFFKTLGNQIRQIIHPQAVYVTKIDSTTISDKIEYQSVVYIVVYMVILLVSSLILSTMNLDAVTSFTASVATLGTVGPGFGETIGSLGNFSTLPTAGKYLLSVNMIFGRLEIMNILALFMLLSSKKR